jgi:hypothetical protein
VAQQYFLLSWLLWLLWLLWLSIVSFADSSAAGKQPAEYPDPGLIQVVDKNGCVYWGATPLRGGLASRLRTLRCSAELRGQSNPPVKGLCRFASTSPVLIPFLHLLQKKDEVTAG